jgi:SP family sugar:H+ symporter-like MFS transporter
LKAYQKPGIPETADPSKKKSKAFKGTYATTIALISSLGGLCFGYEVGVVNQLLGMLSFRVYFGLGNSQSNAVDTEGNIVTTFLVGTIPGALSMTFLSDYIGRKWSVAMGGLFHLLGGLLQSASLNLSMLYCGRFIAGVGVGILSGSVPMYISETSPKETRGRGVNFDQFMITLGILLSNIINVILVNTIPDTSNLLWRTALIFQCFPAVLLLSLLYFVPESPRFYIRKGYYTKAMVIIARCNGESITSETTLELFEEILESIECEAKAERYTRMQRKDNLNSDLDGHVDGCLPCMGAHGQTVNFTSSSNGGFGLCGPTADRWRLAIGSQCYRRRILIGVVLFFFQQWQGINTVMYYSATLFVGMGLPFDLSANVSSTIQSIINVLFTIPAFWTVDRVGRRPLLLWGSAAMCVFMTSATLWVKLFESTATFDPELLTYIPDPGNVTGRTFSALGILSIYLYVASFAMTWGPVGWVYVSEIYPLRVRAIGIGLATTSHWVNNAIIAKTWPYIYHTIFGWQYLIFAVFCVFSFVWAWFYVKETKGLDLEEMDELFGVDADIQQFNHMARQAVRRSSVVPMEMNPTAFPSQFKEELKQADEVETLQKKLEYEHQKLQFGTVAKKSYYASLDYHVDDKEIDEEALRPPSPASSVGSTGWGQRQSNLTYEEWPRPEWAAPITKPLGSTAAFAKPLPAPLPAQAQVEEGGHGDTLTRQVRNQERLDSEQPRLLDTRRASVASIPNSKPPSLASQRSSTAASLPDADLTLGLVARLSIAERGVRQVTANSKPRRPSLMSISSVAMTSPSSSWQRRPSVASTASYDVQDYEGGYDSIYGEGALHRKLSVPDLVVQPDTLSRNKDPSLSRYEEDMLHPEQIQGIVKANLEDIMHDNEYI